ncbi:MAG: tetratricopeptide repeat protein [Chloroflexota bacterium]|nr:tetratricopeptide repeat protein [Chloroflexota bacterium]
MMSNVVLFAAMIAGFLIVLRPLLGHMRWPAERPDPRDDVARAVSSLRDLEFAVAAGTIDPADEARLRARIEASAFAAEPPATPLAPVRTFVVAALLAGIVAVVVIAVLPASAGDRAPGETITGNTPAAAPGIAELEAQARAHPDDVPTRLALAQAYDQDGRASDAVDQYKNVLTLDPSNVAALNGLGLILFRSGSPDGALVAADKVLGIDPRNADALFLKGLVLYQQQKYAEAVDVWTVYLDVGQYHPAAPMVRQLYDDAKAKIGK